MSLPPIKLSDAPGAALREIAAYLRTVDRSPGRAVRDEGSGPPPQIIGFWQCDEWLDGLSEIANECDRLAAADEANGGDLPKFTLDPASLRTIAGRLRAVPQTELTAIYEGAGYYAPPDAITALPGIADELDRLAGLDYAPAADGPAPASSDIATPGDWRALAALGFNAAFTADMPEALKPGAKPARLRLSEIPQLTDTSQCYRVDVQLDYLENFLATYASGPAAPGLDLAPDFQRGHVWTMAQRSAFMEFVLQGGELPPLWFNIVNYEGRGGPEGPLTIVDGLQRLTTLRMFLRGEVRAFGLTIGEFADIDEPRARRGLFRRSVNVRVNRLNSRAAVLRWYLEINGGGTPHAPEELARVAALITAEERQ